MTRISICVLFALAFSALQTTLAAEPFQLEVERTPSGCINISSCTYGCNRFSTKANRHILTPLCKTANGDAPQRLTIRGTMIKPYIFDEDSQQVFECKIVHDKQFVCAEIVENGTKSIPSASTVSSVSASASDTYPSGSYYQPTQCIFNKNVVTMGLGNGNLNDCCSTNADCHGSCIRNACDAENNAPVTTITVSGTRNSTYTSTIKSSMTISSLPGISPTPIYCRNSPGVFGMFHGNGNLNDCCQTSDDCHGSCIRGACNAEDNSLTDLNCIDTSFRGKRNGKGPKGACCNSQADCLQSCVANVCSA